MSIFNKEMMVHKSIVVSAHSVEELENKLNERLEKIDPKLFNVTSPAIFPNNNELIAIVIVNPIWI